MRVRRPLTADFGAEVEDVDLTQPLSGDMVKAFADMLYRHALLLVRAPHFAPTHQAALARALGRPKDETRKEFAIPGFPMICRLGNATDAAGQPTAFFNRQGEEWHSDGAGSGDISGITMLYALDVPREGGETMYASLHAAWDTLDPATQARIRPLRTLHSFNWHNDKILRRSPGAARPLSPAERAAIPDRRYDLVQTHPITGRTLYYVSPNLVREISGLDETERDALVAQLIGHASAPERIYRHRWSPGDLLVWDNNALMHSATDVSAYVDDRRLLHRSFTVPPSRVG
ncbi:MAG: TauD/TfdA family dioxygenase [Alphaproteobacteria bacterium]|nr:TauD/TfdA family dioxygenase [Alphaproteobacteria bacterium]